MRASFQSRISARALAAALLVTGGFALAGCSSMGETQVHGIIITETMLSQVKPGVSQQVVIEALGTPSNTSTIGGEAYY